MSKFYCMNLCCDPNFSFNDWNEAYDYCEKAEIEGLERDKILHPEKFPCNNQCEACINEVIDTQMKNKRAREARMTVG